MYRILLCLLGLAACEFIENRAIDLAIHSGASYCLYWKSFVNEDAPWTSLHDRCQQRLAGFELHKSFFSAHTDGFGYVGLDRANKAIIAVVKGTIASHLTDIRIDLANVRLFDSECELEAISLNMHAGFCRAFHALEQEGLTSTIVELVKANPDYKVVAAGHSLGGGITHLLSIQLMTKHAIPVQLYTYGQPRTGTGDLDALHRSLLEKHENSEYYRITHHRDIVPHLPLCRSTGPDGICVAEGVYPIHSGVHVHYPSDMSQPFSICNEDGHPDCYTGIPISIEDHSVYYGHITENMHLTQFCCPPPPPEEPSDDYIRDDDSSDDDVDAVPRPFPNTGEDDGDLGNQEEEDNNNNNDDDGKVPGPLRESNNNNDEENRGNSGGEDNQAEEEEVFPEVPDPFFVGLAQVSEKDKEDTQDGGDWLVWVIGSVAGAFVFVGLVVGVALASRSYRRHRFSRLRGLTVPLDP
eukprot:c53025_g1_i1.p1 GENE.c53025_g1_i1~~c53025_g1_i1.p1  ORF type:complete len:467 (+),score=95.93 c53025_g1_i1:33-1433(+)